MKAKIIWEVWLSLQQKEFLAGIRWENLKERPGWKT
jgi:hypothetical protein